jgi:hypothetical protein
MKPHGSIRVVRKWCDMRTDRILKCFDNPEGLNCRYTLVGIVHELANGQRLGTMVPSQNLSGAWVTIHG